MLAIWFFIFDIYLPKEKKTELNRKRMMMITINIVPGYFIYTHGPMNKSSISERERERKKMKNIFLRINNMECKIRIGIYCNLLDHVFFLVVVVVDNSKLIYPFHSILDETYSFIRHSGWSVDLVFGFSILFQHNIFVSSPSSFFEKKEEKIQIKVHEWMKTMMMMVKTTKTI